MTELFDESVILMSELLCAPLRDVVMVKEERKNSKKVGEGKKRHCEGSMPGKIGEMCSTVSGQRNDRGFSFFGAATMLAINPFYQWVYALAYLNTGILCDNNLGPFRESPKLLYMCHQIYAIKSLNCGKKALSDAEGTSSFLAHKSISTPSLASTVCLPQVSLTPVQESKLRQHLTSDSQMYEFFSAKLRRRLEAFGAARMEVWKRQLQGGREEFPVPACRRTKRAGT